MAQVKISNLVQQNGPRPLPRKSKMLRNTQDTDGNNGHRLRVGNAQGARFNLHLLQRSSDNRGLPEGIALVKSFDETPITVTNKSFSQLLEEKLSDTLPANTASSQLSKPKKSFLKKGEGLAKFRQKQSSCPSSVPKCSVVDCHVQNKNKNDVIKNVTGDHEQRIVKTFLRKGSGLKRFRLKPITGSRKNLYRSRKNSNLEANNCSERTNWNPNSNNISAKTLGQVTTDKDTQQADHQLDTHQAVNGYSSEGTEREYDGPSFTLMHEDKIQDEFEELRTFELLEQQAANSSFSSNCSFVGRILQISTQSSFNVNCYGTEELESHANFIPVNPVQNTSSAVNTGIIKQYPELQDPLHCTKQQISDVARKITLLQEDMFKFSDDHKDIADDKTVEQNSCSEVANFIQRISHIQKCVELKDCNEIETDEESIREENSLTSNILHRDLQEQIRKVLIDDFKERKHYNSDTECSILSETMCVSIAEDPHTHSEREQTMFCAHKNSHSNFESDKWESNKYSPVKQEADEAVASSNKRVTPLPDCTPSSAQFGKDYQHTSDRYTHQPGDSEDLNLLKSDLLHKRLTELDAEISIYNEEKLKLCALRKEYEIIIQELLSEKETLKSLIDKERAAINIEREEIAEEKCRLEQYKSELMKEKQVLEGLKQKKLFPESVKYGSNKTKVITAVSYQSRDLENEDGCNSLVIHEVVPRKPLPSAVEEETEFKNTQKFCESMPLLTSEKGNVDVHISLINAENCSAKLVDSVPSKMKDCESEELQQPLDVCSIAPQHFVPSKTVKDAPEAEIPSAQNVILTVPANGNIINSSLNKTHTEKNNHVQSNNIQESDDVKKKTPENGNITDFDDAGINSLPKHDFVHYAAQDSNVSTGEINEYINILDDNTLINRKIIPSKLHSADQNVDSDMISNDRVTHIKTHPDGRKEIWYNNGCVCKISSDGMSEKIIYYNGDVLERCLKSQTEKYYFCKSKIWCTTYEDKTQLVEFSNGQTELKKPDGTIKTNYINGAAQTVFPDGHVEWVLNDGRQCIIDQNGEKTWYFPNGQKEIHTKDHKRREYPDGTIKYVFPDGSMKTKYANGRIREKDKHGKLIMDSDLQKLFILFDCDMAACHSMWKPILYKPKHQVTIITEALLTYSKTMLPPEER
ncbi:centromere protein J isoform X6 [Schistocerca serialis cubense]|uniref:centromere protein J isoform X6 n=1 Tax=Schistocerca serialis cubense TaxID=2023355 RepID=UPI00214F17BB|nr:centromere protein J isoform X6 [Schistocerca serialis cubense]